MTATTQASPLDQATLGQVLEHIVEKHWTPERAARTVGRPYADVRAALEALGGRQDVARLRQALDECRAGRMPTAPAAPTNGHPRPPTRSRAGHLMDIPVGRVVPDPDNPREDLGDVTELAESMQNVGLLQPIVCRTTPEGTLFVVAGHRRLEAAKLNGWSTVPVVIRKPMRPDEALAAMLAENGQRKDLDPIEEARALRRLKIGRACSTSQLAAQLGMSQPLVSARMALLSLPIEDQERLRVGQMTLGQAVDRARKAAGTKRPSGYTGDWHLTGTHPCASRARARCERVHGRARLVGSTACGACWESVIRADERDHLHTHSAQTGECALCGTTQEGTTTS